MKRVETEFLKGVARWEQLPTDGRPEVALMGRSNVGKSSLLNLLVGRKAMARVSRTPGRTQELNFFAVGDRLYLVDLPGLGFANAPKRLRLLWSRLIERYLAEREPLALVLHLVDIRHEPLAVDLEIMAFVAEQQLPYAVVLTKSDKVKRGRQAEARRELDLALREAGLGAVPVAITSAEKGLGRAAVWSLVEAALRGPEAPSSTPNPEPSDPWADAG